MSNSKTAYLQDDYEGRPSPPPYEEHNIAYNTGLSETEVRDDGRIDFDLNSKLARRLSKIVPIPKEKVALAVATKVHEQRIWAIKLNIVIQVVGSRGDVQPFIALGNELQKSGHRVRIATHESFRNFVQESNLEFYSIGGDPAELMAYMVKNPGLIPSMKTLKGGEIQRKRNMIAEMLDGCWRSCVEPDDSSDPFVADVIIANPPSFAHIHCAQALGIPVHLCFTMPWSPTRAFPHPLANVTSSSVDVGMGNYLSYLLVDWMTWQGLGDIVNKFRKSIDLDEIPYAEGPFIATKLKIPFTYCWSPALVPKPNDWPEHIDICGFFFRNAPQYTPSADLDSFLRRPGPPIVYIGFGSIVIDDPERLTNLLLNAVQALGVRAIISRGWSKLGGTEMENVFYLDDCPHEWLFQHVSAVVHHGGAGTAACGLRNGRPTMVVPFFGDQPFWGDMVHMAGAGPEPVPHTALNARNLAEGIAYCLTEEAAIAARSIAKKMSTEHGVKAAVRSFHANLPLENLRCDIFLDQPGAWRLKCGHKQIRLSKLAAELLVESRHIERKDLKLLSTKVIDIRNERWEPVTAISSSYIGVGVDTLNATADIFRKPYEEYKKSQVQESGPINRQLPQVAPDDASSSASIRSSSSKKTGLRTAGAMATATAKSIGVLLAVETKGVFVDLPLAAAEGMLAIPALYGDKVRDHGKVTGAKSGAIVAGKAFAYGLFDGVSDLVVQPYKGGKEEGAWGVVKGMGKGTVGLTAKVAGGSLGLFSYPSQGIAKSIAKAFNSSTRICVEEAKKAEGLWMIGKRGAQVDTVALEAAFDRLTRDAK